jgi:hypothetical protein
MHVEHKRLLAKLSQRVAFGKKLKKQALAKAKRNEAGRPITTDEQSAWNYADNCYEK